jgi:glutamate N-acetyltransferase/amino-acid N-acetyltransferase
MIAPSMATMLAVITTDAAIEAGLFRRLLRAAVGRTFNAVTIDGDMSTNDTVFGLASGASGAAVRPGTRGASVFASMLEAVADRLAMMLVRDGEGASKLMEVEVAGARTAREAQACARHVACSPLVKTMLAGSDPNVGRIAAAAGASPARFRPQRLEIRIGGVCLVSRGAARPIAESATRRLLARPTVSVRIDLHAGTSRGRMRTCDLTEEYVRINAGYAT